MFCLSSTAMNKGPDLTCAPGHSCTFVLRLIPSCHIRCKSYLSFVLSTLHPHFLPLHWIISQKMQICSNITSPVSMLLLHSSAQRNLLKLFSIVPVSIYFHPLSSPLGDNSYFSLLWECICEYCQWPEHGQPSSPFSHLTSQQLWILFTIYAFSWNTFSLGSLVLPPGFSSLLIGHFSESVAGLSSAWNRNVRACQASFWNHFSFSSTQSLLRWPHSVSLL